MKTRPFRDFSTTPFSTRSAGSSFGLPSAFLTRAFATVALVLLSAGAAAEDYSVGQIRLHQPFATATPPGAKIGAAYFSHLENRGTEPDRLLRASTPASERVELHFGEIGADGVMRMRELEDMPLPPGARLEMKPGGGNHLMLMDLKKPLVTGETFPLTLEFEHAGKVDVNVVVQTPAHGGGHAHGSAQKH